MSPILPSNDFNFEIDGFQLLIIGDRQALENILKGMVQRSQFGDDDAMLYCPLKDRSSQILIIMSNDKPVMNAFDIFPMCFNIMDIDFVFKLHSDLR